MEKAADSIAAHCWHTGRRKAILARFPEVKRLIGRGDPGLLLFALVLALQPIWLPLVTERLVDTPVGYWRLGERFGARIAYNLGTGGMSASGYYSANVTFELPSCVKNDKSRFACRFFQFFFVVVMTCIL